MSRPEGDTDVNSAKRNEQPVKPLGIEETAVIELGHGRAPQNTKPRDDVAED